MMPAFAGHFHSGLQAGQITDDTEETLMLAESLIEASGFSAARFADKLIAWGTAWTLDERLNRGVGFATRSAVESMMAGTPWQESGLSIPTCGAAMRAAPIGLLYHSDLNLVRSYADLQSLPTHCSSPARAGAVAAAAGVALSLMDFPKEIILRNAALLGQPGGCRLCGEASMGRNSFGSACKRGFGSNRKLSPGLGDCSCSLLLLPEVRARRGADNGRQQRRRHRFHRLHCRIAFRRRLRGFLDPGAMDGMP